MRNSLHSQLGDECGKAGTGEIIVPHRADPVTYGRHRRAYTSIVEGVCSRHACRHSRLTGMDRRRQG